MVTRRMRATVLAATALLAVLSASATAADSLPSGEVTLGQSVIEPAYNDANGSIIYVQIPVHADVNPTSHNTAPFYLIVYPTSVANRIGTVSCQHQPADNCPDHGSIFAALAESNEPVVYSSGVWGHDHMLAAPGSGGDFNIDWLPIAVIFTPKALDTGQITHITTLAQLRAAEADGDAEEIALPAATFHCNVVAAAPYNQGTPVPPGPPTP